MWTDRVRPLYGLSEEQALLPFLTDEQDFDVLAVFSKQKEAEIYRNKNPEWQIVPVNITYEIPLKQVAVGDEPKKEK